MPSQEGSRPSVNELFRTELENDGWEVVEGSRSRGFRCWRGDETMHFIALGVWELRQTDMDSLYGRALRAISTEPDVDSFVIVLPESAREFRDQVHHQVRKQLGLEIAVLHESGRIEWTDGVGVRWFGAVNLDRVGQAGSAFADRVRRFGTKFQK